MSNGDDDGEDQDPEWQSVVEDSRDRIAEIEGNIDDIETADDIDEQQSAIDALRSTIEDSVVPADSEEYETLMDELDTLREQIPPTWMPIVWTLETEIETVESDIDNATSQGDLEALDMRLDDILDELDSSAVPADADEHDELESQVAAVREAVPPDWMATVWAIQDDLSDVESKLDGAELESELDEIETQLDQIESEIESSDIPEDADERAELTDKIEDFRSTTEEKRGPYADDITDELETAEGTLTDTDWTPTGEDEIVPIVESFLEVAENQLTQTFEIADGTSAPADLGVTLTSVRDTIDETGFDPDDDRETIQTLLEAAKTLSDDLDTAESWGDLTVREELGRKGFYDVLTPENRKDFPPEWTAIKIFEKQYQDGDEDAIEMILLALEKFESDFMVENILDSLERIAPPEAFDALNQRAQKRDQQPIRILGKIGDERALETIHDFIEGGDTALRKTSLQAIGAIGSEESTQPVANQLADDNPEVRSVAARTLGLIGDTRAIEPLSDVLAEDTVDEVRASAAWALNQIGTERAREAAAKYADDTAYIVQVEAEKAQSATEQTA